MEENNLFATAFYITNEKGVNVRSSKSNIYFDCICVFFASLSRFHPKDKKVLFINANLPVRYDNILEKYGVEVTIIKEENLKYVNCKNISNKFPGCLFSLDVFKYLFDNKKKYSHFDRFILMDNDVLTLRKVIFPDDQILGIPVEYDFNRVINGQSRSTLSYVNAVHGRNNVVNWYGGELIALKMSFLIPFYSEIEKYFNYFASEPSALSSELTEEHIYSIIISNHRDKPFSRLIKRVWTTYGYDNISGDEFNFDLLHYPSEKTRLFSRLFLKIEENEWYLENLNESDYHKNILEPVKRFVRRSVLIRVKQKLARIKKNVFR